MVVYEVYNKFDGFVYEETLSEQKAYSIQDNLNNQFGDIDPVSYPWAVTSRFMADSYKEILMRKLLND